jgi:acetoin utilization deacetylase AcuC-like enzyme
VTSEGSFEAALHAAGGAVALVDLLLDGQASSVFSAHRPPGHHALPTRAMGFCLFNSIAIAATHALRSRGIERVMILDWDVHHGNGTNDIFHASDDVLFISIHESPLYPGTGRAADVGIGDGSGYTVNLPVSAGADDALYRSLVDHVVVPLAAAFEPELVLISAGYDAHRDDPLATCDLTEEGFAQMTRSMRRCCEGLGAPLGAVLEGGYALGALARSVAATLEELQAPVTARSRPASASPSGGRCWLRDHLVAAAGISEGAWLPGNGGGRVQRRRPRHASTTRVAIASVENRCARARPSTRGSLAARCGASAARHAAASNGPQ